MDRGTKVLGYAGSKFRHSSSGGRGAEIRCDLCGQRGIEAFDTEPPTETLASESCRCGGDGVASWVDVDGSGLAVRSAKRCAISS